MKWDDDINWDYSMHRPSGGRKRDVQHTAHSLGRLIQVLTKVSLFPIPKLTDLNGLQQDAASVCLSIPKAVNALRGLGIYDSMTTRLSYLLNSKTCKVELASLLHRL